MKKMALAAGAASLCLVGTIAAPAAFAHPSAPQPHLKTTLHVTASPTKGVKAGSIIHVKATHGLKSKPYYCIMSLYHKGVTGNAQTADTNSLISVTSTKKGKIKCGMTFLPFSGTYEGKTHHCPSTKKDKKGGWGCDVSLVDVKHRGMKSFGYVKFTAK